MQYGYDNVAPAGCTPPTLTDSNGKGRRTSMCDASGATSWAHDTTGKILTEKRIILGITKTISYFYNLDGSIATVTYPSGKQVAYTVSNAQRLTAAKDPATGGPQFAILANYAPTGALNGMITGQISGGFGGITESHTYNNSLEYTSTKALPPTGPAALDLTLSYNLTGGDNGTVTGITNNADTLRTQTLTYDPLNRILSAKSAATSPGVDCWGQVFGPDGLAADDAIANLTKINNGSQTPPPCPFGPLNATVDANNHFTADPAYAYDAPGNMTKDGSGTGWLYAFDAENRLTLATGPSSGPYCYVYDGLGLRVAKKSGSANDCTGGTVVKLYWRSISGDSLAETDGSGSTTNTAYAEYVFFAGRRIASRTGTGTAGVFKYFYYFADQLGSTRTITTGSGSGQTPGQLCYDADFTPYGQEISYSARLQTTACPPNYKFTGYERDSETGLDYAFAHYYSARLGRFLSTDPLGGSIGDLQSHNAYAYTRNNPLNSVDPSGMNECPDLKMGCMPSDECLSGFCGAAGVDLFGGDPLGCRTLDFWGGDCAIENRMASNVLGNIGQLELQFFLDSLTSPINAFVGDDCNGGPCFPFFYYVGNGCFVSVSYYTVNDIGGQYSMPTLSLSCSAYQQRGGGRVGGGADGGGARGRNSGGPTMGPQSPPPPPPNVTAGCMVAALGQNFLGSSALTYTSIGLHVVAYAAVKRLAPAVFPGPGWAYVGLAVLWDAANITKSYADCKYNGGPQFP